MGEAQGSEVKDNEGEPRACRRWDKGGGRRSIDEKDDLRGGRGRVSRRLQVGGACESRKSRLERRFVYDEI